MVVYVGGQGLVAFVMVSPFALSIELTIWPRIHVSLKLVHRVAESTDLRHFEF